MSDIIKSKNLYLETNDRRTIHMGMTMTQKILAAHAGLPAVEAGQLIEADLDLVLGNDVTTPVAIHEMEKFNKKEVFDKKKIALVMDHFTPNKDIKSAEHCKCVRQFSAANEIENYFDVGAMGIEHALLPEKGLIVAGETCIGADSHTCTYGALGAFGTGVGCTDFLYAMVTGKSWVMVPETLRFNLKGKLREGVYPRDLILTIIGDIGANGANYKVMEFAGEGAHNLSVNDRFVLCNLAVEAGAKTGIVEPDEKVEEFIKEHGRRADNMYVSDEDAKFLKVYEYDLDKIEPVVARPDFVDDVIPLSQVGDVKIDEAFLGSCNNGRIDDLRVAAEILKGRKVNPDVRFLIAPASNNVYIQALDEGLIDIFMESGAMVMNANCSVCWGSCQGVIGENEVLISTGTRNFKGRAGHKTSKVYLGSAATVTASAIAGKICGPDEL